MLLFSYLDLGFVRVTCHLKYLVEPTWVVVGPLLTQIYLEPWEFTGAANFFQIIYVLNFVFLNSLKVTFI